MTAFYLIREDLFNILIITLLNIVWNSTFEIYYLWENSEKREKKTNFWSFSRILIRSLKVICRFHIENESTECYLQFDWMDMGIPSICCPKSANENISCIWNDAKCGPCLERTGKPAISRLHLHDLLINSKLWKSILT